MKELEDYQEREESINHDSKVITQAVILAAGERKHFEGPAGLLDINGTILLERTVNILEANGITKIVIVTGYQKERIEEFNFPKGMENITLFENPRYLWTGSMASLAKAANLITDDFILIEDDILIEEQAIVEILNNKKRDCLLITKESGSGDEAFVEIRNGHIHQISKDKHRLNRIDGEMVGITKISYEVYQGMLDIYANNRNPYVNYEYLLLDAARTVELGFLKLPDIIWTEIDNHEDYLNVKDKIYNLLKIKEEKFKEDDLRKLIAEALKINKDLVTSIESLGGLTNRNFKAVIDGDEYAVRVPGMGTEKYLNRFSEKVISEKVSMLGIHPDIVYFNEHTGLKIVEYVPNAETLNPKTGKREDNLIMVADIFKRLHQSGEDFGEKFDVFEKINEYETVLKNANGTLLEGYHHIREQVFQIKEDYQSLEFSLAPCHIDPLAENFVKSGENKMFLIDWEYAGMNDPFWDVAAYIIESELSPVEEKLFLLEYFNGEINEENAKRLLLNKIFLDFVWTIWALMKEANGEDFGSYANTRFTRAKNNLTEYRLLEKDANSKV
jgi:thiamine kinase-like enzyme/choline kinase